MDNLLQGIAKVCVYLDDILITGATEAEYLRNLQEIATESLRTSRYALEEKQVCVFASTGGILGSSNSQEGLHPTKEKVRAIVDAPAPCNVTQLKSFLRMLNYYGKFFT